MVREAPQQPPPRRREPQPYPAEKARGAEIILRRPWQRWTFFGGLAAILVLLLVLRLAAGPA